MTHLFKEGYSYKLGFESVVYQGSARNSLTQSNWSSFRLTITEGPGLAGSQIPPRFPLPTVVGDEDRANLQ